MSEILDIYDANLKHLGTKAREDVHRDGDWHRVFHCWVIYRDDNGRSYVIVQKRHADKETHPNKLDVSAAGHYEAGETIKDGIREVKEELGLDVVFSQLVPVGRRVAAVRAGELLDYEVADVCFLLSDTPLEQYRYQQEEVAGLLKIDVEDALKMFSRKQSSMDAEAVGFDQPVVTVKPDDFVATHDNYYYKVMVLAKRCLDGEDHLII